MTVAVYNTFYGCVNLLSLIPSVLVCLLLSLTPSMIV